MAWAYLVVAGLFEVAFAAALKASDGFSKLLPSLLFLIFSVLSFVLLARAVLSIPIGTAYSVWTGIGAAGTVIVGILAFGEPANALRLFFLVTLIVGIVGLRLS
jgi:quaternary ammonium compound-resistance protein SugE